MKKIILLLSAMALLSSAVFADTKSDIVKLKEQLAELESNQQVLIDETSSLKTGFDTVDISFSHNGMGAAASKVYTSKTPLSIGGYGDIYVKSPDNGTAKADVYHFVPYIGYKFSDSIILNTELEFEHGGSNAEVAAEGGGENNVAAEGYAVVEFMYLDFLIDKTFNLQLGKTLVPMGLINLRHEPVLFNTIQKPLTELFIVPSTWAATGVNAYGTFDGLGISYNAGMMQALELNNGDNGTSTQIEGSVASPTGKTDIAKVAFVGRLDYRGVNGLLVGTSIYYGDATQGSVSGSSALIYDLHTVYEFSGFKLKALYSASSISNPENIASNHNGNPASSIKNSNGYYVNAEYDVLASFATTKKLPFFVQYDHVDPASTVVDKFGVTTGSHIGETTTTTFGINYFPQGQVVLKLDYAITDIALASKTDYNTLSVALGFIF